MKRIGAALVLGLVSVLTSCSGGGTSGAGGGGNAPGNAPTFHKDVEPILQQKCQSCHSPGHIAPFSLTTYADAKPMAGLIGQRVIDGSMPPWGAWSTDECSPKLGFKDDKRLTQDEITTITNWIGGGALEGDPKDAPPPVTFGSGDLPGVEVTVKPQTPFVSSGDKDQFRCFVLDPGLTEDKYLNGTHFIAGNPKVVHHALMYLDEKNESAALVGPDGSYDCFGGPEISSPQLIAAWAPGGVPSELAPNIGLKMSAGSKLVMQIHYHPAGTTGDPDATSFQMRFTKAPPEYIAAVSLIGNFSKQQANGDGLLPGPDDSGGVEFRIPADATAHTETMKFTMPMMYGGAPLPELRLYGVATHMHYVGTDMKIDVARASTPNGEAQSECFLQTPKWNFNWQRFYDYDAEIANLPTIHGGDVLNFRCTYDNSKGNPFVAQALLQQNLPGPVDVSLGESTLDEMCLGAFVFIYKSGF
jgi:hypothetical protein